MALNDIAFLRGPATGQYFFSFLSHIALCDRTHDGVTAPITFSLVFLNNSWSHSTDKI